MEPLRVREVILTLLAAGGAFAIGSSTQPVQNSYVTTSYAATQQVGSSGSVMDGKYYATSDIDVRALTPNASTSSNVAVTGAAVNDPCIVTYTGDWTAPSSSLRATCSVISSGVATIRFSPTASSTTIDVSTSTYGVLIESF